MNKNLLELVLLRIIQRLQTADSLAVVLPADGRPDERAIVSPAGPHGTVDERMAGTDEAIHVG